MEEWRGKIGLLLSARNHVMEVDFNDHRPQGISVHASRIRKEKDLTNINTMTEMLDNAEGAAELLAQAGVDVAIFGCTAASFVKGAGEDLRISEKLGKHAGIPVITTSTAVTEALRFLKANKLTIITPYVSELNKKEEDFFHKNGFEVLQIKGMDIEQTSIYPQIKSREIYHFSVNNYILDSDCLFISCTNFRAMEVIPYLEMHLQVPVVTSNQASLWMALRHIGIKDKIKDCGRLMEY